MDMTEILILSVGSNPMPNFIVADYLLTENRKERDILPKPNKIMFVYSSGENGTEKFKKTICQKIKGRHQFDDRDFISVNLEDNQRKFDVVKSSVTNRLEELGEISSIHLNYTGGTKPMAVGISSAVEDFTKCNNKIYSDLSPRRMKLTSRDGSEYPTNSSITDYVKITVEELYELHNLQKPDSNKLKRKNSELYSEEFVEFLVNKNDEYKKNVVRKFYDEHWVPAYKSENKSVLLQTLKDSSFFRKLEDFTNEEMKRLRKFIIGDWLEEHLLAILLEIKKDCKLTDIAWNVETQVKGRPFELDVIAIKGCESFVFTCTSAYDSKLCKSKAFEGFYRSFQIGGEASKIILVCMADNFDARGYPATSLEDETISNVEKDMSQFDAVKNFYILGSESIRDRENFKEKLITIIEGE